MMGVMETSLLTLEQVREALPLLALLLPLCPRD